ncbi:MULTISPECIES: ribosome maturation factor RimM [Hydrogenophaga]|uniref:Ribosome maturation factor RimM n=2 Tax=Hydrogenophaga TaxID=47420 RepID=A0ABW2QJW2_9BURK
MIAGLTPASLPADAVEVGRLAEAWGIKGWLHVHSHSADPQALFYSKDWFLCPPEGRYARGFAAFDGVVSARVDEIKEHAKGLVALLAGLPDRTAAEALKGARIFISRQHFPPAEDGEYYWVDLLGLDVVNREGVHMGVVKDLMPTGPHSVLCLDYTQGPDAGEDAGKPAERLIPFVSVYVDKVDLAARCITVDWQTDY